MPTWCKNLIEIPALNFSFRKLAQPDQFGYPKVIGKQGSGDGEFNRPWGVCPIPDGGFCVADRSNNRLQFFTGSGEHLLSHPTVQEMGEEMQNSEEPGKFNRPAGVAFTNVPVPAIIVADKDNHRIQVCLKGLWRVLFGTRIFFLYFFPIFTTKFVFFFFALII